MHADLKSLVTISQAVPGPAHSTTEAPDVRVATRPADTLAPHDTVVLGDQRYRIEEDGVESYRNAVLVWAAPLREDMGPGIIYDGIRPVWLEFKPDEPVTRVLGQ